MNFEELKLSAPILKAVAKCGHHEPTPIQVEAIPKVLAGHDLIASAQTGTGKTAAFVLPILQILSCDACGQKAGPRVLILTPTRELANQITQTANAYSRYLNVHTVAIYGGMPFGDQIRALSQIPAIVVATPGRLIDLIWRGRINLSHVDMLVLDEADRMLDMGFIEDVEFVSEAMPENCQTLLFAATMGEATVNLAKKLMKDPERVEVAPGRITHDAIEQRLHFADNLDHKNSMLRHLCCDESITRAIIFSATKRDAESLARDLTKQGHPAAALHGDMTQTARNRTVANLRKGKIRLLVATDVAARGLDITGISHVINFDLPRSAEDYVNRIGRTGRAGKSGIAISFASRADFEYLDRIESYLGQNLSVQVIPGLEPKHAMPGKIGRGRNSGNVRRANGKSARNGFKGRTAGFKSSSPANAQAGATANPDRGKPAEHSRKRPYRGNRSRAAKPKNVSAQQ